MAATAFVLSAVVPDPTVASAQATAVEPGGFFAQQGAKLVASDANSVPGGAPQQGSGVALSADGNTLVESGFFGAVWVFTRSGSTWTEQAMLQGPSEGGGAYQGPAVAVSADGDTALVGYPADGIFGPDGIHGAAWVFTRTGTSWTPEAKLVGTDVVGGVAYQGESVALSADGATALVGGPGDDGGSSTGSNAGVGAAWVFTRSGSTWNQQAKLVGTGAAGAAAEGASVALSAAGDTALIGGLDDNSKTGAAWVFVRSGATWSQQGPKLVGTVAGNGNCFGLDPGTTVLGACEGGSVALSSDGNTALIGGNGDNAGTGATWVFTRSGTAWTQQAKLIGTDASGAARQGGAVALSGDGTLALIGGGWDNNQLGAAWAFRRSGSTWIQQGSKIVGTGKTGLLAREGDTVALSADGTTAAVGGPYDDCNPQISPTSCGPNIVGATWVFAWAPAAISSFAPTSGQAGTVVTITGTNLSGATGVEFNGTKAFSYTVNSNTQITATVPSGTTSGPITITLPGGSATSTTPFAVPPPANLTPPTVSGTTAVGRTLRTSHGTWNPIPSTYVYEWMRCAPNGSACLAIAGATQATYRLAAADAGHTIRSAVKASNSAGSSSPVTSMPTSIVVGVPAVKTRPKISGSTHVAKTLRATTGTWTSPPSTYSYQWLRCDPRGRSCRQIAGANKHAYRIKQVDAGHRIRVRITARNAAGKGVVVSAATPLVKT